MDMNNNEVIECKHYCPNYYSDDIGYEEKDRINACGLTRTGYHEMSYKKCSDVPDCYFKQLVQLKADNEQLTQKLEKAKEALNLYAKECPAYSKSEGMNCFTIGQNAQQALAELRGE